jgi:hypothetical protein
MAWATCKEHKRRAQGVSAMFTLLSNDSVLSHSARILDWQICRNVVFVYTVSGWLE